MDDLAATLTLSGHCTSPGRRSTHSDAITMAIDLTVAPKGLVPNRSAVRAGTGTAGSLTSWSGFSVAAMLTSPEQILRSEGWGGPVVERWRPASALTRSAAALSRLFSAAPDQTSAR